MNKFNTVLFDLDGTVLDTAPGLMNAINETIAQCGFADIPEETKQTFIGPPIDRSFRNTYGLNDEETAAAAAVFRKAYSEKYLLDATPYPGIIELMHSLRRAGWKVGIATYKRNDYAQRLMQETGVNDACDFTLGSDGKKQTKADIIQICLKELGCNDPAKCIMVGDTIHDHTGAVNANTAFLGVTYGFGFRNAEEVMNLGALAACRSAEEMEAVFASVFSK